MNLEEFKQRAQEAFENSRDLTVGLEEEFALLDPQSLDLVPRFEQLQAAAKEDHLLADSVAGELISSEIEIRSGVGEDLKDAANRQKERRSALFELARRNEIKLAATGTHPWADYRQQPIIDTEHYRRVEDGLKYVAWRNNTFSMHVHVGINGLQRAIKICDRLRPVLPQLLALSANSPFMDGRNSGLHTVRTQAFTKSFPRCGVPDAFGSWQSYSNYLDFLFKTNSIVEFTQVWWSIRPHLSFGTVEVRICDAQSLAEESDALAELIVACVAQAAIEVDAGERFIDPAPREIEENMWRAIRFGLDGRQIDLETGEEFPAIELLERLTAWTAPARKRYHLPEPQLPPLNGAQRQLRMIERGCSDYEVFSASVDESKASYSRP